MEVVEVEQKTEDIQLLLAWDTAADQARSRRAGTISIITHIAGAAILFSLPAGVFRPPAEPRRIVTPLVFPSLKEPTQKELNTRKVSKSFNVESLLPQP